MPVWYPNAATSIFGIFYLTKQTQQRFIVRFSSCLAKKVKKNREMYTENKQFFFSSPVAASAVNNTATSTTSTEKRQASKAKVDETNGIKYQELLQHFKSVQARHEKQRRQCNIQQLYTVY